MRGQSRATEKSIACSCRRGAGVCNKFRQFVNATGKPVSYKWELIEKPEGADAEISATDRVAVEFSADKAGEYVFKLTVTYLNWTATDTVKIKLVESDDPGIEARAGEDQE